MPAEFDIHTKYIARQKDFGTNTFSKQRLSGLSDEASTPVSPRSGSNNEKFDFTSLNPLSHLTFDAQGAHKKPQVK
jgi:hypothetical protein